MTSSWPVVDANVWVAAYDATLRTEPLSGPLLLEAVRLGTANRLRAADALYAVTPLVWLSAHA